MTSKADCYNRPALLIKAYYNVKQKPHGSADSLLPFRTLELGPLEMLVAENKFNNIKLAHGTATLSLLTLPT
jgi:hypothetical protein